MRLHNLHIRVTAEERDYIAILDEHMNCSMSKLIETFSNPQQSWGDSWTQGAINVVP